MTAHEASEKACEATEMPCESSEKACEASGMACEAIENSCEATEVASGPKKRKNPSKLGISKHEADPFLE